MFKDLMVVGLVVLGSSVCYAAEVSALRDVGAERTGEFVRVEGKVTQFFPPPGERDPMAFTVDDGTSRVRVVVWGDIFGKIEGKERMQETGTSVTLTAEVAEYKEKLELHVADWDEVQVGAADAGNTKAQNADQGTSAPVALTTETATLAPVAVVEGVGIQAEAGETTAGTVVLDGVTSGV